jgi:diamine N-acetyltransferase
LKANLADAIIYLFSLNGAVDMDVTIRKATEKDYPGLVKLYDDLNLLHSQNLPHIFQTPGETPQSLEYIKSLLVNPKAIVLVAEMRGLIIGFVQAELRSAPDHPVTVKRQYVYIGDICVKADHRRSLIGTKLIGAIESWAAENSIKEIDLNVWDFNKRAMAFFEESGFKYSHHTMEKTLKNKK